jgi:hypothetical protein
MWIQVSCDSKSEVQRMCKIWLTQSPQSIAGIELLKIAGFIHENSGREQWGYWMMPNSPA